MPTRSVTVNGKNWLVFPSGRVTQYDRDEFGLIFVRGSRSREQSLIELSDAELQRLFGYSQPSDTSPEADYSA
jgi:hypothetical protein